MSDFSSNIEPLPLGKVKRIHVNAFFNTMACTVSLGSVEVFNRETGSPIYGVKINTLGDLFRKLGYDVTWSYTAPLAT